MKTIKCESNVFPSELPVIAEADVVVAGTGPGGLGAAVLAARSNATVVALESYGLPGGMAAVAEIHPFMPSHCEGRSLDAPVYEEWVAAMNRLRPPCDRFTATEIDAVTLKVRDVDKNLAALGAEELLLDAGVKILYHHTVCGVIMDGRIIRAAVVHSKSGFGAVVGKCFVDCTGDGDLAALAGCSYELGDDSDHYCQPMTLCFKLCNVKKPAQPTPPDNNAEDRFTGDVLQMIQKKYHEAVAAGRIHCLRENVLMFNFKTLGDGVVHFNTTRVVKHNALSGTELSEAEIDARRQLREFIEWFRAEIPGFENVRLLSMGSQIGVRESRRITGIRHIDINTFRECRHYPDAVVRCAYPVDLHSPTGSGTLHEHLLPNKYYEIPYGCVVPRDCDNLTVGGRPISGDMGIHSSFRVMPPATSIGQAAGVAAALAAQRKVKPAELDGVEVRKKLIELGARL